MTQAPAAWNVSRLRTDAAVRQLLNDSLAPAVAALRDESARSNEQGALVVSTAALTHAFQQAVPGFGIDQGSAFYRVFTELLACNVASAIVLYTHEGRSTSLVFTNIQRGAKDWRQQLESALQLTVPGKQVRPHLQLLPWPRHTPHLLCRALAGAQAASGGAAAAANPAPTAAAAAAA